MTDLKDKVAIVTGGASGLGKATAQRLVGDGATVIITDVRAGAGKEAASDLGCDFLEHDVVDERRWDEVVAEVLKRFGGLDILVNNAGIVGAVIGISPEDCTYDDWKRVMAVNVDSVFLGCRAAIRAMRTTGRGGSIVNIGSIAGEQASAHAAAYGASKAAVTQLSKSVAQHCAREGLNIRCNSVHPGNVYTPLHDRRAAEVADARGVTPEEVLAEIGRSPLGGWVPIEQIAAAVSYLVSDEASYVTGTRHIVDGGALASASFTHSQNVARR